MDWSCSGCEDKVESKIEEKKDRGEELTEKEKQIDRGKASVPFFYGPFALNGVTHCKWCHRLGQVGAFAVALLLSAALYVADFSTNTVAIAFAVSWGVQFLIVGVMGRYPILGATLGPKIEQALAGGDEGTTPATDGGTQTVEIDADEMPSGSRTILPDEDDSDSEGEKLRQLKRQLDKKDKVIQKKRDEIQELRSEHAENEEQIKELRSQIKDIQSDRNEFRDELQEKEEQIDALVWSELEEEIDTAFIHDERGVRIGPVGVLNTVEIKVSRGDGINGTKPFAAILRDPGEYSDGMTPPDRIGRSEIQEYKDRGVEFFPDPMEAHNVPQVEHPGKSQYPDTHPNSDAENYPNVLYWEDKGEYRESLTEFRTTGGLRDRPTLTIAWTRDGQYVPPSFDPRGFENYNELRERNRKLERKVNVAQHRKKRTKQDLKDAKEDLKLAQDRIEDLEGRVEELHEQRRTAVNVADEQSRRIEGAERSARKFHEDKQRMLEENEEIRTQKEKERQRRLNGNGHSVEAEISEKKIESKAREKKMKIFYEVIKPSPWEPGDYSLNDVGSGVPYDDVIADFLNADSDAIRDDKDVVRERMQNGMVAEGGASS